jgi:hypothetical protein
VRVPFPEVVRVQTPVWAAHKVVLSVPTRALSLSHRHCTVFGAVLHERGADAFPEVVRVQTPVWARLVDVLCVDPPSFSQGTESA